MVWPKCSTHVLKHLPKCRRHNAPCTQQLKLLTLVVSLKAQAKVKDLATSFLPTFAKWTQSCLCFAHLLTTTFLVRPTRLNIYALLKLNLHSPTWKPWRHELTAHKKQRAWTSRSATRWAHLNAHRPTLQKVARSTALHSAKTILNFLHHTSCSPHAKCLQWSTLPKMRSTPFLKWKHVCAQNLRLLARQANTTLKYSA